MLDDDSSSSLPAQEYVKPTQDYAAAVRADMEAEIEIDIAAQQKYQQQPLQAERSDKKTKEESL